MTDENEFKKECEHCHKEKYQANVHDLGYETEIHDETREIGSLCEECIWIIFNEIFDLNGKEDLPLEMEKFQKDASGSVDFFDQVRHAVEP